MDKERVKQALNDKYRALDITAEKIIDIVMDAIELSSWEYATCGGTRQIREHLSQGVTMINNCPECCDNAKTGSMVVCPDCSGTGYIIHHDHSTIVCLLCKGQGIVRDDEIRLT